MPLVNSRVHVISLSEADYGEKCSFAQLWQQQLCTQFLWEWPASSPKSAFRYPQIFGVLWCIARCLECYRVRVCVWSVCGGGVCRRTMIWLTTWMSCGRAAWKRTLALCRDWKETAIPLVVSHLSHHVHLYCWSWLTCPQSASVKLFLWCWRLVLLCCECGLCEWASVRWETAR